MNRFNDCLKISVTSARRVASEELPQARILLNRAKSEFPEFRGSRAHCCSTELHLLSVAWLETVIEFGQLMLNVAETTMKVWERQDSNEMLRHGNAIDKAIAKMRKKYEELEERQSGLNALFFDVWLEKPDVFAKLADALPSLQGEICYIDPDGMPGFAFPYSTLDRSRVKEVLANQ